MFRREYHYFLNERGQLFHLYDLPAFLAGRRPIGPAALADPAFLDFFSANLRRLPAAAAPPTPSAFRHVSLCQGEANLLACDDAPVVFTRLAGESPGGAGARLGFGGTLSLPFEPAALREAGGRLYHPAPPSVAATAPVPRRLRRDAADAEALAAPLASKYHTGGVAYGLLASPLALELGFDCIDEAPAAGAGATGDGAGGGGGRYTIDWGHRGVAAPIAQLPGADRWDELP